MPLFFISAAILVVICLAWLLIGLTRAGKTTSDQEAANIQIAQEKLATLDSAKASGAIDEDAYAKERQQLEHALAAELVSEKGVSKERDGSVFTMVMVAIFVPISAGALYLYLGTPEAINNTVVAAGLGGNQNVAGSTGQAQQQAPNLDELLPKLEARLKEKPDDVEGWRLLGRTYLSTSRFDKAVESLEKAVALDDQNPDTIASLAEALAMQSEGNLAGRPMELVNNALELDSYHPQSLWLLAIGSQQAGDHQLALEKFDILSSLAANNHEALANIDEVKLSSEQALGIAPPSVSIEVRVDISNEAKSSVKETDTVFVFARAQSGPPMPLAVSRHTVKDLPITIVLDESMAMIPSMTLANFPDVVVGARVSASGNAISEPGDWFAESSITITDDLATTKLVINEQKP